MVEYFRNISNINEFKYVFNKLKTPNVNSIKDQMKVIFSNNADNIYDALKISMRENLGIEEFSDFLDLIEMRRVLCLFV